MKTSFSTLLALALAATALAAPVSDRQGAQAERRQLPATVPEAQIAGVDTSNPSGVVTDKIPKLGSRDLEDELKPTLRPYKRADGMPEGKPKADSEGKPEVPQPQKIPILGGLLGKRVEDKPQVPDVPEFPTVKSLEKNVLPRPKPEHPKRQVDDNEIPDAPSLPVVGKVSGESLGLVPEKKKADKPKRQLLPMAGQSHNMKRQLGLEGLSGSLLPKPQKNDDEAAKAKAKEDAAKMRADADKKLGMEPPKTNKAGPVEAPPKELDELLARGQPTVSDGPVFSHDGDAIAAPIIGNFRRTHDGIRVPGMPKKTEETEKEKKDGHLQTFPVDKRQMDGLNAGNLIDEVDIAKNIHGKGPIHQKRQMDGLNAGNLIDEVDIAKNIHGKGPIHQKRQMDGLNAGNLIDEVDIAKNIHGKGPIHQKRQMDGINAGNLIDDIDIAKNIGGKGPIHQKRQFNGLNAGNSFDEVDIAKNINGKGPIHQKRDDREVVEAMKACGTNVDCTAKVATEANHPELVNRLIGCKQEQKCIDAQLNPDTLKQSSGM
ncbi:hypothetical protein FN846DRAFT_1022435 [Sphaerosporella brunnea]|uniref:Uncharacterized protein n=1 Tax=Sphaerosporella brunnea TaxID=1250544 RepID=A0A5J5ETS8_9PEZI|nr:hypothetical protein FN846DRAFT_1022435 [Sphaerosporella brunnea]